MDRGERVDFSFEQDLVAVDISNSGEKSLVHQDGFDFSFSFFELLGKEGISKIFGERVDPQFFDWLFLEERSGVHQINPSEKPQVGEI